MQSNSVSDYTSDNKIGQSRKPARDVMKANCDFNLAINLLALCQLS